jgi:hypothetical protein
LSSIADPDMFLERIDHLGISALASKPITLKMLLATFRRSADLPGDVLELYEKGSTILCEEQNESRRASGRVGNLNPKQRVDVAARVAAVTQFGNRFAVWTGTEIEGVAPEDVAISELSEGGEAAEPAVKISRDAVLETLGTGLFSSRGPERLGWSHQTFAEYLAARYCVAHQLSIEQLRSLVFHPRRRRVIPQLREVASWLALQNGELFAEIAESEPDVLLGSPAPSLRDEQRRVLTDALLRSCDQSGTLHVQHNLKLRHLAHPGLADQLRPVLSDRGRSWGTRYLATRIVRDGGIDTLGQPLLDIALSDKETHDLRSIATYAIADLGSEDERLRLGPLLQASREIDPNDQLRGAALDAIYPGDKYDDEMWNYLEHPRESLFFGSYNNFLSYAVPPKLNVNNLPAALKWCARQPITDLGPIPELEGEIFAVAIEHIEVGEIAELVAQAIFERCKSYRGFPQRGHRKKDLTELLLNDDARRRAFLGAFLKLLTPQNEHFLFHPVSLLHLSDLTWFIDRVVGGRSCSSQAEARIISRLMVRTWEYDAVLAVWMACQVSSVLATECNPLFEAVSLDSELARWERESRVSVLKEKNISLAPELMPRCEAALESIENGKCDDWLRLTYEMSVDEGGSQYMAFCQMIISLLPGWLQASDGIKERMVAAAKCYLEQSDFPSINEFPSNQVMNGASAGVNALALLASMESSYLRTQTPESWMRWIPSLILDGRARGEKEHGAAEVFRVAAEVAPEIMTARLLEQIQFENAQEQRYLFCSAMVDRAWCETLASQLLDQLRRNAFVPSIQADLVAKLVRHDTPGARQWAEETVRIEYKNERGLALAKTLVNTTDDASWNLLWPLVQEDVEFGRKLLEDVSYASFGTGSFSMKLRDEQLGELYAWLLKQYPPNTDRRASGAVGPVDTARQLRDATLDQLKRRATFDACDALAQIELRFPEHRWLGYHFHEGETLACAATWVPSDLSHILAMAANRNSRLVESGEQLLHVVLESLDRLQRELHGDLAAVGDLWNSKASDWWPKEEEDISDYIARFLRRDLVGRRIVINREVQIRRGRRGEMSGQSTDIHVDLAPPDGQRDNPYGSIQLIIEVKGSWNDGVMDDMEGQLRDRYMRNNSCRIGVYVVAHFSANRWIASDDRRRKSLAHSLNDLRTQLSEQAQKLSGAVHIRSFVLDASLDSTSATGIE